MRFGLLTVLALPSAVVVNGQRGRPSRGVVRGLKDSSSKSTSSPRSSSREICSSSSSKSGKGKGAGECIGLEGSCLLYQTYGLLPMGSDCPDDPDTLEALCGTDETCISNEDAQCLCEQVDPDGIFDADLECKLFKATVESLTFWERTGGATSTMKGPFLTGGTEMNTRITTLGAGDRDFFGTGTEHYDVFWSDLQGNFDIDGCSVTVEAIFAGEGGLNLARVDFNLIGGGSTPFADTLDSFNGIDPGYRPANNIDAVDGDLTTHTFMGSSTDQGNRLRVTVSLPTAFSNLESCNCNCLEFVDRCCNTDDDSSCDEDPIETCEAMLIR